MPDELEERLRSHARSFDSLLSLIPAKLYYGEDVSDQWKRKKQTPEEKRAAKMAKLDPDNWKSAKDVMDERSASIKRKRDEEEDEDERQPFVEPEQPRSMQEQQQKLKKRKIDDINSTKISEQKQSNPNDDKKRRQAEKKALRREKKQKEKDKRERQKLKKQQEKDAAEEDEWHDISQNDDGGMAEAVDLDADKLTSTILPVNDIASTASSSEGMPDIMSPPAESGTSSVSSIIPENLNAPTVSSSSSSPKPVKVKSASSTPNNLLASTLKESDKEAARARLTAAISTLRTQRKADSNPRSRQELLDQRRRKEEARRLAKKEQRQKEKEEAARKADEEIEKRFSPGGSGSLLGSPRSPPVSDGGAGGGNTFSFGRIVLGDGTEVDSTNLSGALEKRKGKGPQDAQTAFLAAKNKATRIAGFDEQKRKEIQEKDMWLNAKRRAHGERVRDDTSLLKKALKRQEGQKRKSEKEWNERKEGIQKSQEARQKKRTDNLQKRKDERKHGQKGKKVKRPGFEGSFRGRTGGKKK